MGGGASPYLIFVTSPEKHYLLHLIDRGAAAPVKPKTEYGEIFKIRVIAEVCNAWGVRGNVTRRYVGGGGQLKKFGTKKY